MTGVPSPFAGLNVVAVIADRALRTLRDRCVPEFGNLADNPRLPDRPLNTLLEWADDLGAADPSAAFDLEVLEAFLPALNTALLASYSFSGTPAHDPLLRGRRVDLELTDLVGALLVERTRTCASPLAVAFQGAAGEALVRRANDELRNAMETISQAIARQR